ncbi:MAG: GNAT family N-acetyltransferase, partial [Deltaproteobacteria bacterium]|nr:GNAT family N-acetyltransferase [Deltaproteobacteria bacterium]
MPYSRVSAIKNTGFKIKTLLKVPCFSVDLKKIRQLEKPYLVTLSPNTRYQIRRSIREYELKSGQISLSFAKNKEQAVQFFREAGDMHKDRWDDSGFNNSDFTRFHENLIHDNFDYKLIELIKVTTATSTIAIMYNLLIDKKVYFYLQGLKYEEHKKIKPGLVAHSLITQYYIDKGMELYDYMGGYSQYKSQLASHSTDCYTICIQRPLFKFSLENMARKFKYFINRKFQ